jgi:dipeptidyl aminopeptidase/acylaminoacyl peptidase
MPDSRHVLVKVTPSGVTVDQLVTQAVEPGLVAENGVTGRGASGNTVAVYASPAARSLGEPTSAPDTTAIQEDQTAKIDRGDLAVVDVATGSMRRLTRETHPSWYAPSPDGQMVAFAENRGTRDGNNWRRVIDLYVVSLHDSASRLVGPHLQQEVGRISWSPDSKWLAYTELGAGGDGDAYVVAATGGAARNISHGSHADFNLLSDGFGAARVPLWDPASSAIYLIAADTVWRATLRDGTATAVAAIPGQEIVEAVASRDGRYWSRDGGQSMYVKIRDKETKAMGYAQLQLDSGKIVRQFSEPMAYGPFEYALLGDAAEVGSQFVYVAEDAGHPGDVWLSDTSLASPRQLTHLNPQLDSYAMGASQIMAWDGLDGRRLHGALLLPADYKPGQRYALIVNLCGGNSCSQAVNQFGVSVKQALENGQLFATRGYAVLVPDAPQEAGTPMADLAKAILPGINRLVELGIADPDRLGVIGHSYGGYATLALLVQTARFKAAVTSAAPANWFTLYGELSPTGDAWGIGVTEDGQGLMRGTPWQRRDKYIENSPYFYLDRITTPVLIVQGANDEGVYAYNSDELFVGLRRLGREAVYLKYEGEGHFLTKYENRVDYLTRIVAWFGARLSRKECPQNRGAGAGPAPR